MTQFRSMLWFFCVPLLGHILLLGSSTAQSQQQRQKQQRAVDMKQARSKIGPRVGAKRLFGDGSKSPQGRLGRAGGRAEFILGACAETYTKKISALLTSAKSLESNTGVVQPVPTQQMVEALFKTRMDEVAAKGNNTISCSPGLVINAAPGSSGTRSFFLATAMMNLPSAHFKIATSNNCSLVDAVTGVMSPEHRVYSDTPYPNMWWQYISQCPRMRTVFTIVDAESWVTKRRRHKKRLSYLKWLNSIPIPFEPVDIPSDMISLFSLHNSSIEVAGEAYRLYKELVFCSTHPNRRLVIDYTKLDPPSKFWPSLNTFLGAGLGEADLKGLIAAGLPYWGHSSCFVGTPATPCPASLFNESRSSYRGLGLAGPCA